MWGDLRGWRTIGWSAGLAVVGVVEAALRANGTELIPAQYVGPSLIGIGFVTAWLRSRTNTPVGVK